MSYVECDLVKVTTSYRRRIPPNPASEVIDEEYCSKTLYYRILLLSLVFLFYSSIFYLGVMGHLNLGNLIPLSRLAHKESVGYAEGREEERAEAFEKRFGAGGTEIPEDHPGLISMIHTLYLYPPLIHQSRSRIYHEGHHSTNPLSRFVRDVFRNKTNGFFLEYPANNGISASGTSDLEHNLRWNGLLIEPIPTLALQVLRLARNVWISDACLSTIRKLHKSPFGVTSTFGPFQNDTGGKVSRVTVQCVPLYSLLLAVNVSMTIDYFYLDIRADEYKILQVIPYDLVRIGIIVIRNWQPTPEGQMIRFLEARDYISGRFSDFVIFVHASLRGSIPNT